MGQDFVTKERLLNGKSQRETIETSLGPVEVRPLTNAEKGKVEALSVKGISVKSKGGNLDGMEIDLEKTFISDYEANMVILACGLSVSKEVRYTVKDLKESTMEQDVQDALIGGIKELSGMTGVAAGIVSSFRRNSGGERAGDVDPDGEHAASEDPGRPNAPTE